MSSPELIAEARGGDFEDRGWMIDIIDRLADALEKSDGYLTEALSEVKRLVNLPATAVSDADVEWDSLISRCHPSFPRISVKPLRDEFEAAKHEG